MAAEVRGVGARGLPCYRVPIIRRPRFFGDGEEAFWYPRHLEGRADEGVMCMQLACDRQLFGQCYRSLLPKYFWNMPRGSGVFVSGLIPTGEVLAGASRPGDIDLLVIPYEKDELVLYRTVAAEVKVIRASYAKPGRSPNEFGFSQASHLMALGFPHVAVIHLIVSDDSPTSAWRRTLVTEMIDGASGLCAEPREFYADMLPVDLLARAFGRLKKNRHDKRVGIVAAYMGGRGLWYPEASRCRANPAADKALLDGIGAYFARNVDRFLDNPRYDPVP